MLVEFVLGVNEDLGHRYVYVYRLRHQVQKVNGRKRKVRRRTLALHLTYADSGALVEDAWYWDPTTMFDVFSEAKDFFSRSRGTPRRKLVNLSREGR